MPQEPVMFSSIAPAPLFAGRHYASKDADAYASRYLDISSSPYLSDCDQPKRYSEQPSSAKRSRTVHARSSSLHHDKHWRRRIPTTPNLSRTPNLSKPLPPPPQELEIDPSSYRISAQEPVLATILDASPTTLPSTTAAELPGTIAGRKILPDTSSKPRGPPGKPSSHRRKGSLRDQAKVLVPSTIIELPTPRASTVSPPPLPTFTITRSTLHRRPFYTYTPANPSAHPRYTLLRETDHLFQVRRNASTIAEIKAGYTGHHAKVTFSSTPEKKTEIERRGAAPAHLYSVEIFALGQTCNWREEDGGRLVLRDGCMGTVVARADLGEVGRVEVVIEAGEPALDEIMVSYMAVVGIRGDGKDDGLAKSVAGMLGNVI